LHGCKAGRILVFPAFLLLPYVHRIAGHMAKIKGKSGRGSQGAPKPARNRRQATLVYILLIFTTLAVYSQTVGYDFVSYRDAEYVSGNPNVRTGITRAGLAWAFTSYRIGMWFPLTWMSHMVDSQLFGLRSGLHHLTNVLLHLCSTLLLFALLKRMTGSRGRSAFVACLFALHPLHVESVAWITQRRDVLGAVFWFLTIWEYLRYIARPNPGRYLLLLIPFCLGLLADPTIITLPIVLVLLDLWPLRRIRWEGSAGKETRGFRLEHEAKPVSAILLEKALLFELAAAAGIAWFVFSRPEGGVMPQDWIPIGTRMGTALISYVTYLAQLFWPVQLAVYYPTALPLPAWWIPGAGLAVAGISFAVLSRIRSLPYLAVGWLWYLVTLAPVFGLVRLGMEARADRYTYIPLIGIFILLSWGVADALRRWPRTIPVLAGLATAACAVSMVLAWHQVQVWRTSETLFRHALSVTTGNYVAHYGLGEVLRDQGRLDEAVPAYLGAIDSAPKDAKAYGGLADVLLRQGRNDDAVTLYREAVRLNPNAVEQRISLGIALIRAGKAGDSIAQLLETVKISPNSAVAHYNLGRAYAETGQTKEAAAQFAEAVRLQPGNAEAHYNLGSALAGQGKMNEAVAEFETAVRLKPDYASAHNNLGSALANLGRIDEAVAHFSEAVRLTPGSEEAMRNLQHALSLQRKPGK
jgi:protein O-mannosyl-transferase